VVETLPAGLLWLRDHLFGDDDFQELALAKRWDQRGQEMGSTIIVKRFSLAQGFAVYAVYVCAGIYRDVVGPTNPDQENRPQIYSPF
jgi:hypothetical protein